MLKLLKYTCATVIHGGATITNTNLIVRWEDEIEDDDQSNQSGLSAETKRFKQLLAPDEQSEDHKTQECVHL